MGEEDAVRCIGQYSKNMFSVKGCMGSTRLTGVVAQRVEDSDEVVQAGPVVRIAVKTLLEGVPRQRDAHQLHGYLTDLVPHVHVGGVQHHGLDRREREESEREGDSFSKHWDFVGQDQ